MVGSDNDEMFCEETIGCPLTRKAKRKKLCKYTNRHLSGVLFGKDLK
jgi:hypothetical protein